MKKVLVILAILLLVSCSMTIKDPDGWEIYQLGWSMSDGEVLIQSHDGYMIDDNLYNETIKTSPVIVKNVLDRDISVKITYAEEKGYWETIPPLGYIEL